jgi:hypothetical protein
VGDDVEKFFQSTAAPKSEFETTAQYESRRSAALMTGKQLVLLLDDGRQDTLKYDADAAIMTATIPTAKVFFLLEPNRPTYPVIKVHKVDRQKDEYIGQNGFGVERRIDRLRSDLYGLSLLRVSIIRSFSLSNITMRARRSRISALVSFVKS